MAITVVGIPGAKHHTMRPTSKLGFELFQQVQMRFKTRLIKRRMYGKH
jgi:hypothetical protein